MLNRPATALFKKPKLLKRKRKSSAAKSVAFVFVFRQLVSQCTTTTAGPSVGGPCSLKLLKCVENLRRTSVCASVYISERGQFNNSVTAQFFCNNIL